MTLGLFFVAAGLAVLGALGVLVLPNPIHCALSLVGTMVALAVIYLLHHAEFIFAIQIMVYAGAIMTLLVFVIMLLDLRKPELAKGRFTPGKVFGGLLAVLLLVGLVAPAGVALTGATGGMTEEVLTRVGSVEYLADQLFGPYLLPFEIASILLLVGLVGAVSLAKKKL